jgi:cytochrome c
MTTIPILTAMLVAAAVATPVLANEKLARDKQCLQCHTAAKDTIGPSFRTIRATYKGMRGAEGKVIRVIRDGSDANLGPHWGPARMPNGSERPPVSEVEARQLARWILSGRAGR